MGRSIDPMDSLLGKFPEIAKEADGWDPKAFSPGSNKKMNWRCKKDHNWDATIYSRTTGHGCPYCAGQRVITGVNDLETEFPGIASEADGWDPKAFMSGSHKKMDWKCIEGHTFTNSIGNRTRNNQSCPYCVGRSVAVGFNDLSTTHPELALEADGWDPTKYSAGSEAKVNWKCGFGHSWATYIYARTSKSQNNCPVCSGRKVVSGINDLATTHPELALQAHGWDPTSISYGSGKKLNWICPIGHVWASKPNSRSSQGSDCLICSNKEILRGFNDLATTHPELALQAHGWDPTLVTRGSSKIFNWICPEGHVWPASVANRTNLGHGCPSCAQTGFNPSKEGYFYFLIHPNWEMLQIGITNFPDDRLAQHKKLGWLVKEIRGPMDGVLTRDWEKSVLKMLRNSGADLANKNIAGKFDGYSEAWSIQTYPANSISELFEAVRKLEGII